MKKLTKEQEKIIYISAVVLASLFLFWAFIYLPQARRLGAIKNKLSDTENQILEITSIVPQDDLKVVVINLNRQFQVAISKLPAHEETVIQYLSDTAKKIKIEVKDIVFSDKQALKNKIPGYAAEEMVVSMNLTCDFRSLGEYLDALRNNSALLIKVRQLDINGNGEGNSNLSINLQISAYLSRKNS